MIFSVDAGPMAGAVNAASRMAKGGHPSQPIRLTFSAGAVAVESSDFFRWLKIDVPGNGDGAGSCALNGAQLAQCLGGLAQNQQVKISISGTVLSVRAGKSVHTFPTAPDPGWSVPPVSGEHHTIPGLREAIGKAAFAMSDDVSRPSLRGVHLAPIPDMLMFHGVVGNLAAIAANGFEIAVAPINHRWSHAPLTLPDLSIGDISKMLASKDCKIVVSENLARFEAGPSALTTKLVADKFPDWRAVIPRTNDLVAAVDTKGLSMALDRASRADNKGAMYLDKNTLTIKTQSEEAGSVEECISAKWDHEPMAYGFKLSGLRAILESVETEECFFLLRDKTGPLIVRERIDSGPLYMTMPLYIKGL